MKSIFLILIFMMSFTIPSFAMPYFAVRHGYKCSQCHVNRTGGGKRNPFGVLYSQTVLPMKRKFFLDEERKEKFYPTFHHELSEYISSGANLRLDNKTVFKKHNQKQNTFTFSEGNLYLEMALIQDRLSLYFDENFAPSGASSREALGMWTKMPFNGYVKAGRFMLPYGWRLLDDTAFVRSRTNINYDEQDFGLEIGFEPGIFSTSVSMTNGTSGSDDDNTSKQVTGRGEVLLGPFRVGLSFMSNRSSTNKRVMTGLLSGFNIGKLTLLGEIDRIFDKDFSPAATSTNTKTDQIAIYTQGNYQLLRGLNIQLAYEFLDPDTGIGSDNRIRVVGGVELYLTQFLQASLFYRYHAGPPQQPTQNEDEMIGQLHVFF